MSKSYPAKIEFEIEPLEDDQEVETVEESDDERDSESVLDGQEIINPYTGELEKKPNYPEVEYLDLENVQDTEQVEIETAPPNPKVALAFKRQRQLWRETNKHEWLNIYHQFMEARAKEKKKRGGPMAVPEQWSKKIIKRKPMKPSKPQVVFENTKNDENSVNSKRKSKQNVKSVKKIKLQKIANEIMEEYVNNKISALDNNQEEISEADVFSLEEGTTTEMDAEKSDGVKLQEYKKRLLEEFTIEDEAAEVTPKEGTTKEVEQADLDKKDGEIEIHEKTPLKEVTLDDGAGVTVKIERHTSKEDLTDEVNAENYGDVEFLEDEITPNDDTVQQPKRKRTPKRKQTKWKIKTVRQLKQLAAGKGADCRQTRPPRFFYGDLDPQASVLADPQPHITQRNSLEALRIDTIKLIKYSNLCLFKWGKDMLTCFYCQQRFKHMSMLREHTKSDHNFKDIIWKFAPKFYKAEITDLTCTRCNFDFDSLKELQAHLRDDHGVKFRTPGSFLVPYKLCTDTMACQVCGKELPSRGVLQKHMKRHILKFTCEGCSAIFIDEKSLTQHKCLKRELKVCRVCGESFNNNGERKHHEVKVHEFRSKVMLKFKCSYCSQRFRYNYKKVKHMIDVHGAESEMYQCSYCPQVFITVHWCSKHMNRAHRDLILGLKKK